jgi:hypothetical protein
MNLLPAVSFTYLCAKLHGVTFHETINSIDTAGRPSNLTLYYVMLFIVVTIITILTVSKLFSAKFSRQKRQPSAHSRLTLYT